MAARKAPHDVRRLGQLTGIESVTARSDTDLSYDATRAIDSTVVNIVTPQVAALESQVAALQAQVAALLASAGVLIYQNGTLLGRATSLRISTPLTASLAGGLATIGDTGSAPAVPWNHFMPAAPTGADAGFGDTFA